MSVLDSMETRSIDTAKDASVDLMTLNKKVVNMRAVVRRSKVYVINKLTRNIADLKKKKGTEEQKEQNLKKAQRYLDEVQSIRSLKEDKISKYSIANVSTFEEVSKQTLSSGARAMARLADHHFVKDAVSKFREEHSDWRDLAAYMLMQQTGRKFKSQKKDKKNKSRVENINASKLMTKAYTQAKFRDDGFQMMEEKSEKKRKKNDEETIDRDKDSEERIENKPMLDSKVKERIENVRDDVKHVKSTKASNQDVSPMKMGKNKGKQEENLSKKRQFEEKTTGPKHLVGKDSWQIDDIEVEDKKEEDEEGKDEEEGEEDDSDNNLDISEVENSEDAEDSEEEDDIGEEEDSEEEDDIGEEEDIGEEGDSEEAADSGEAGAEGEELDPTEKSKPEVKIDKRKEDCVIRQLDIESNDAGTDSEEDFTSSDNSEETDSGSEPDSKIPKIDVDQKERSKKRRGKAVPDFLTKGEVKSRKLPRDPFFEGNEMMMEEEDVNDFEGADTEEYDPGADYEYDIREKFSGNKRTTKSLFYRPGDDKRKEAADRWKGSSGRFDRGRGRGRGGVRGGFDRARGGFQDRPRGGFHDGGRGGFDRRGRGSFRGMEGGRSYNKPDAYTKDSNSNLQRPKFSSSSQKDPSTASKSAEKLHPSWEASRKRKAEQSGGIKAFSGTKITFDE